MPLAQQMTIKPSQVVWVPEWCQVRRWNLPRIKVDEDEEEIKIRNKMSFKWEGALSDVPEFKNKTSVEVEDSLGNILWKNYQQNETAHS